MLTCLDNIAGDGQRARGAGMTGMVWKLSKPVCTGYVPRNMRACADKEHDEGTARGNSVPTQ
jgi:hypothetical protein